MSFFGSAKVLLNKLLAPMNVRVDSLTVERAETRRLETLVQSGQFEGPVYPVPEQFRRCDPGPLLAVVRECDELLSRFARPNGLDGFCFVNGYYESPDAEILYAMVRLHRPDRIIEIGSGNSTLLFRAAIEDAGLTTRLISIDPHPRRVIEQAADEFVRDRIEDVDFEARFGRLGPGDVLFIDSSHRIEPGNDVVQLFLNVLPGIGAGAIVHVHDIFLPFEYPEEWLVRYRWQMNEQYLVQALLQGSDKFEVLWAGRYLQHVLPDFARHFRHWRGAAARSLWLRRANSRG